jgi:hypothetical protein
MENVLSAGLVEPGSRAYHSDREAKDMSDQGSLQEVLDALNVTREAFFAAIFGKGSLPAVRENPIPALLC